MDTLTFTFCGDLFFCFFVFFKGGGQLSRISSLAPFSIGWEQHTSVAFQNGIGNCMTLKNACSTYSV